MHEDEKDEKTLLFEQKRAEIKEKEKQDEITSWPWETNQSGEPYRSSRSNATVILTMDAKLKNMFRYNEFSRDIEIAKDYNKYPLFFKKGALDNNELTTLTNHMCIEYEKDFTEKTVKNVLLTRSQMFRYNPVKERIESKPWDGKPRLDTVFTDYLGAEDTLYTREVCRRWFAGMIFRAYKPGGKFEIVPVFTGSQGVGKSSFLEGIYPEYFTNNVTKMTKDKDQLAILDGAYIVEIEEMSAAEKSSTKEIKAFVSSSVDEYRGAYDNIISRIRRHCVFAGTTNEDQFLIDQTGNRRFYPIKCGLIKKTRKTPFNVEPEYIQQVLAEAKYNWEHDQIKTYFNTEEDDNELNKQIAEKLDGAKRQSEIESIVDEYINMQVPTDPNNLDDEDWDNYDLFQKRQYWNKHHGILNEDEKGGANDKHAKKPKEYRPLEYVQKDEIFKVVVQNNNNIGSKRNSINMAAINRILTAKGWLGADGSKQKTLKHDEGSKGVKKRCLVRPK